MHVCTFFWSLLPTNRILFWVNNHDTSVICVMHLRYIPVIMHLHYNDVIMGAIASQITSLTMVYSTDYSDADQRIHQSSASLAFVRGIHRGPVISPYKWPVTRKMFPFDDGIMVSVLSWCGTGSFFYQYSSGSLYLHRVRHHTIAYEELFTVKNVAF